MSHVASHRASPAAPCRLAAAGVFGLALVLATALPVRADGPPAVATLLLKATTNVDGLPLVYPAGTPQVTARIVEIPPGGETGRHRHPTPLFAYILDGEVTITVDGQSPRRFKAGDALMETAGWHNGRNEGERPVRLLAVYLGAEGTPLAIKPAP